jgi:adenosylhomocysteine nucleosidase
MALLYIAAEASELKPFANALTGLRPLKWPLAFAQEGIFEGRRILLAANGAGPKLAAKALEIAIRAISANNLQSSLLEAVVSVGLCGALDPDLREGQIVVAAQVRTLASDEVFPACPVDTAQPFVSGLLVSQDRIATSATEKSQLRARFGAVAVEMEAFGVAARAKRAGLPFCCIKVVSDRADDSFGMDFNESRSPEGRISRGKIVLKAVARPSVIPELFRLKRRAEMAAGALGDFLVSCRFNLGPDGESVPRDNSVNVD